MQTDRVKLLKFISNFCIGGTERQFVNLSRSIDPSRFELHLACLERRGELLKEIEMSRIPVSEYRIQRLYHPKTFKEQLGFAARLKQNKIQIIHAYNFYGNVFAIPAARLAGVPVVVAAIRDMGPYLTLMKRRAQKFVCRFADCIVVNAEAIRKWLIAEGYSEEKIIVIRNGIDLSRFDGKTNGAGLRHELGLPLHAPLVLLFSRLNPLKGVEDFLQAAAIVTGHFPEVRFLIAGDAIQADYMRDLKGYVVRLGLEKRVVFAGFRLDMPELLSEVAVSVLPSLSEGLSNTLLESMAAGVPVVATDVGGNPEVVEEGVTGLLVPPRNPEAIARALCLLLKDPKLALRLGQAGKKRVIERFSLEHMVRETESLYLNLLKKATHREERLTKKQRGSAEDKERSRRIKFFRDWFEGFVDKPMSMRSTGQSPLPKEYFASTAEFISQTLQLDASSDSVLDVGCDSAMVSRLVAPRSHQFVGVDFIPGMVAQIPKQEIRCASSKSVFFAAADGRSLPFRPHTFSKIYCSGVIHTLPSHQDGVKMIEDLTRVCRPGGAVLVANIPDVAKHMVACLEVLRRGAIADKIKLLISLAIPRWAKNLLLRLGLQSPYRMTLLEYDFNELKEKFEAEGFECQILHFSDKYWSRDFRLTRSNLLIRIPHKARLSRQTAGPEADTNVSTHVA